MKLLLGFLMSALVVAPVFAKDWKFEIDGHPMVPNAYDNLVIHREKPSNVKWAISLQKTGNEKSKDFVFKGNDDQFLGNSKCSIMSPEISYKSDQHIRYRTVSCFRPNSLPAIILISKCDTKKKISTPIWDEKLSDGKMFLSCF